MMQEILAEREASGMTGTWDEFLCVELNDDQSFTIYTGRREVLAEASDFYNEDTEEYEIPEEIDGQAVWGVKDDCIVSESVGDFDDATLKLANLDLEVIKAWLVETNWIEDASAADVKRALVKLKGSKRKSERIAWSLRNSLGGLAWQ